MQTLLDELRATVGAAHVLTDGDLSAWEQDWRKRDRGRALAVVRPGSTAEVAAVVQACIAQRERHTQEPVSIVPQGGNTGLVLGGTPDQFGSYIRADMERWAKVVREANIRLD